jgi:ADP-heptose:LPS heptosyltransferase
MSLRSQEAANSFDPESGKLVERRGSCLVLMLRHLGDALISSTFVRALRFHNPHLAIDVLGRPQTKELVTSRCDVREYLEADFPFFGHHHRDLEAIRGAFQTVRHLRSRRYQFCINLIGDVREALIGRLIRPKWNIAPIWPSGHAFKKKMTDSCATWFENCGISIPPDFVSYYDSLSFFASCLGLADPFTHNIPQSRTKTPGAPPKYRVSLHPGASHPSRHWPQAKWRELMRRLHERGYEMQLFGSRHERNDLLSDYGTQIAEFGIVVVTEGFSELLLELSKSDLLVGMDSLSAHAAFSSSVRSVVLNGSSDPRIMTPPTGVPVSAGHLCNMFPCNYRYPCKGGPNEYVCCREISVESVLIEVDSILRERAK